eukprot:TRINITY_DN5757_c0_g1_i1.p1 TRINITY_DN5757_c0_g1~~TRINITY_DN5757_c0_g1_i1.p1  ORF type:complete len:196 (-),score=60.58 TRINITY_DN5757_c0_g1_i1:637-1224(-)
MDCPICGKKFPADKIDNHVNRCLDGQMDEDEPKEQKPEEKEPPPAEPMNPKLAEEARKQQEMFEFWLKKRAQEVEDSKFAANLNVEEKKAPPVIVQPKVEIKKSPDQILAEKLWKEEQDEQKKKEREASLQLIREQVKREADAKIAEAEREKLDLERRLREARAELETTDTHAAINLEGTELPKTWTPQTIPFSR